MLGFSRGLSSGGVAKSCLLPRGQRKSERDGVGRTEADRRLKKGFQDYRSGQGQSRHTQVSFLLGRLIS